MLSRLMHLVLLVTVSLALASPSAMADEPVNPEPPGGASWIDVRTPQEYAEGRVSFAVNIPHEDIVENAAGLDLPRDRPIYVYCGSGRRAGIARDALLEAGYTDVTNLGSLDDALEVAGEGAYEEGGGAGAEENAGD